MIVIQILNWFLFIAQVAGRAGNSRLVFGFILKPINRKTLDSRNQQSSKPESVFYRSMFHVIHRINFEECFYKRKSVTPFRCVLDILTQQNGVAS